MSKRSFCGPSRLLAIGVLAAAVSTEAYGQLPVSRPAAMLPISVTAAATTPIGIPFMREPVARDVVSGVSGQIITALDGGFTVGAFANTHFLLITTGPDRGTGLPITANTATTLTVSGTIPALSANEDEFEIVPLHTLASLFGAPPINLTGSGTAGTADKVSINGIRYFYKSTAPGIGWKLETNAFGPDQGGVTINNLAGVSVVRLGGATTANVRGVNRSTRAVIPIATGTSLVSWPYPGEVSLASSGLQSTLTGSGTAGTADKVSINGVRYFYKSTAPGIGWKLETNAFGPDQGAVILNPGNRAFTVIRLGAATTHPVLESFVP